MKSKDTHKELQSMIHDAKQYCREINGLPYCKNCGIDFKKLWDMVESLLAEQEKEHKKLIKRIIYQEVIYWFLNGGGHDNNEAKECVKDLLKKYNIKDEKENN